MKRSSSCWWGSLWRSSTRRRWGGRSSCETGRHLQGYGVSSLSCGGHGKRVQLTAQSPGFMRRRVGVMSGKPVQQEVFVSHNSLQLLLQVVCDLQAVLVNQAAAASTSAIPAAVIFAFVLVGCFGWRSLPAQSLSPLECGIFLQCLPSESWMPMLWPIIR